MAPLSFEASNTKVSVAAQSKVTATQDSTNLRCIFCGKQHYVYITFSSCGTYYLRISITFVSLGHGLVCGIWDLQQATVLCCDICCGSCRWFGQLLSWLPSKDLVKIRVSELLFTSSNMNERGFCLFVFVFNYFVWEQSFKLEF